MKTKFIMLAIALIAICSCSKENSDTEPVNDNAELLISVWSENDPSSYKKNASRNENSPNFHHTLRKGVAKYYLKLLQYTILYHVFLLYRGTDLDVVNRP